MRNLLPLLSMLTLFAGGILLAFWGIRMNRGLPAKRLELIRDEERAGQRGGEAEGAAWKKDSAGWYAAGLSNEECWQIIRSFARLHLPPSPSLAAFFSLRLMLALGAGAAAFLAGPKSTPLLPAILGAAAAITGWMLPLMAIGIKLKQHRKSVGAGLPDALELLAICVGAGLSLENALHRVAAEVKTSRPALSEELSITWAEIAISPSRDQALANMAGRVNLPAVRSVIGTLTQSLKFGTPLAQSLRTAASEMRNQQLIELEEQATRLPALLTIPVMLFIMPSMFLIVGGPAALKLMDMFK